MYYALPPACAPYGWGGYGYYHCGGVYYEPRYEGDTVVYVTVPDPLGRVLVLRQPAPRSRPRRAARAARRRAPSPSSPSA